MRRNKNGDCGRLGAELRNKMALGWNQLFQISQFRANETKVVAADVNWRRIERKRRHLKMRRNKPTNKNGDCGRLGAELRNKMALGWNQLFQIGQFGANETKLVATSRATDVGCDTTRR